MQDTSWYEKHAGSFVAIADGQVIGEERDRNLLATKVGTTTTSPILIAHVVKEEPIQLLSPFHLPLE